MSHIESTVHGIRTFAEKAGLKELSRLSGVPYTTLIDWQAKDFRPKQIEIFARLAVAASASGEPETDSAVTPEVAE